MLIDININIQHKVIKFKNFNLKLTLATLSWPRSMNLLPINPT